MPGVLVQADNTDLEPGLSDKWIRTNCECWYSTVVQKFWMQGKTFVQNLDAKQDFWSNILDAKQD